MTRRNVAFILVALAVSLPLAAAVIAHSEQSVGAQPAGQIAELTGVVSPASDGTACDATQGSPLLQEECVPQTCQITCPADSCSVGPCGEGLIAKCKCRANGQPLCGCAPCV